MENVAKSLPSERLEGGLRVHGRFHKETKAAEPLVSVITAVLNGADHIQQTIESVLNQTYRSVEYIVIDGGSTDTTLEIISKYEDRIAYWVSEPDHGIYDAMNKGLSLARGDWLYFLGSDDAIFDKDVLSSIFCNVKPDVAVVLGNVVDENGRVFRSKIEHTTFLYNTVHHQAAFYRRDLFADFRYSTRFRVVGDYELNLRVLMGGHRIQYEDLVVAKYSSTGISHDGRDYQNLLDYFSIRRQYINYSENIRLFLRLLLSIVKGKTVQRICKIFGILPSTRS